MKNKKGITLIALIITAIVMLILVGVTINVALNGGLFEKAKTAKEDIQKELDREQLISAVIGTLDNNGNLDLDQINGINNYIFTLDDGHEECNEIWILNPLGNIEFTDKDENTYIFIRQ